MGRSLSVHVPAQNGSNSPERASGVCDRATIVSPAADIVIRQSGNAADSSDLPPGNTLHDADCWKSVQARLQLHCTMPILFHCVIVAMIVIFIAYAIDHAPSNETSTRTRPRTPYDGDIDESGAGGRL